MGTAVLMKIRSLTNTELRENCDSRRSQKSVLGALRSPFLSFPFSSFSLYFFSLSLPFPLLHHEKNPVESLGSS